MHKLHVFFVVDILPLYCIVLDITYKSIVSDKRKIKLRVFFFVFWFLGLHLVQM